MNIRTEWEPEGVGAQQSEEEEQQKAQRENSQSLRLGLL